MALKNAEREKLRMLPVRLKAAIVGQDAAVDETGGAVADGAEGAGGDEEDVAVRALRHQVALARNHNNVAVFYVNAGRLAEAGKEVVFSTLALVEAESEVATMRRFVENEPMFLANYSDGLSDLNLAETIAITELYLLYTRRLDGWVRQLNRVAGIAVGMATEVPPHNLSEICNAIIQVIINDATEAAFWRASLTTFVGSMMPALIMSTYSSLYASNPSVSLRPSPRENLREGPRRFSIRRA